MNDVLHHLEGLHPAPHPLVLELEERSHADGVRIVPRETGRFLATLVRMMQANRILEIGTGYGYATLWMALAQPPAGKIWTIDPNTERTRVARSFFERTDDEESLEILHTPALDLLENFPHRNLDIVFIDGPLDERARYVESVVPMLKRSGVVILNGCLDERMRDTVAAFLAHPSLDATILPLGEGIGLGVRVS